MVKMNSWQIIIKQLTVWIMCILLGSVRIPDIVLDQCIILTDNYWNHMTKNILKEKEILVNLFRFPKPINAYFIILGQANGLWLVWHQSITWASVVKIKFKKCILKYCLQNAGHFILNFRPKCVHWIVSKIWAGKWLSGFGSQNCETSNEQIL